VAVIQKGHFSHTKAIINQVLVYFTHKRNGGTVLNLDGSMLQ